MLISIGVVLGLFLVTSNPLERRQNFYVRATAADGLSRDTRVMLQGLQVGRVTQVVPRVDTTGLYFVAQLSLQVAYRDGTPLHVPAETRAIIAEPSPISPAEVRLEPPELQDATAMYMEVGDTLESTRIPGALDLMAELSEELKDEILQTLELTRALMVQSTRTLLETQGVIKSTEQVLVTTTPKIDEALELLAASLERTDRILSEVGPRIAPLQDSLALTLTQARQLIGTLDTLATDATVMLGENRSAVREALERLTNTTRVLDNFAVQVTRRPMRLLTGVKPPDPDTSRQRQRS